MRRRNLDPTVLGAIDDRAGDEGHSDLYRILKTYREKVGLPDIITTHCLRHAGATGARVSPHIVAECDWRSGRQVDR